MSRLKVLVIDDEPGIRSGVERILRNFKVDYPFMDEHIEFDVLEAPTGEEGIEIIEKESPEIILLDNKLPGIQGIDVLEYVKKNNIHTIVIMITSYASLELAVKATRDGAYDFIPKPFTPGELRASIENISKHIFLRTMTKKMNVEGKQIRFQFLSVLSHELKAPLNAIEGYMNMVQDRQLGESFNDYEQIFNRIQERVKGMRNMIMDLLDLTKLESGKMKRNIKPINLVTQLRSAIDIMQPYAIQKEVKVYVSTPDQVMFEADPDEMEIVFNNLISNAIKYNRDGGTVDCKIRVVDDSINIIVTDTGIGMAKQDMTRLFREFVRIKNEQTKFITGSGLGLSIVKKLIELYNGEINVCSVPDKGSTFTITLPLNSVTQE
ncbi:MAG: response regulator [Bacteroidales bacterium]|nr:response regulator [Bacteroidales bacterium]